MTDRLELGLLLFFLVGCVMVPFVLYQLAITIKAIGDCGRGDR
jgi:hypothetical protein